MLNNITEMSIFNVFGRTPTACVDGSTAHGRVAFRGVFRIAEKRESIVV